MDVIQLMWAFQSSSMEDNVSNWFYLLQKTMVASVEQPANEGTSQQFLWLWCEGVAVEPC